MSVHKIHLSFLLHFSFHHSFILLITFFSYFLFLQYSFTISLLFSSFFPHTLHAHSPHLFPRPQTNIHFIYIYASSLSLFNTYFFTRCIAPALTSLLQPHLFKTICFMHIQPYPYHFAKSIRLLQCKNHHPLFFILLHLFFASFFYAISVFFTIFQYLFRFSN